MQRPRIRTDLGSAMFLPGEMTTIGRTRTKSRRTQAGSGSSIRCSPVLPARTLRRRRRRPLRRETLRRCTRALNRRDRVFSNSHRAMREFVGSSSSHRLRRRRRRLDIGLTPHCRWVMILRPRCCRRRCMRSHHRPRVWASVRHSPVSTRHSPQPTTHLRHHWLHPLSRRPPLPPRSNRSNSRTQPAGSWPRSTNLHRSSKRTKKTSKSSQRSSPRPCVYSATVCFIKIIPICGWW